MRVRQLNNRIFSWDPSHPARVFLERFIDCHAQCVGIEGRLLKADGAPLDQVWKSSLDGRTWSFSQFSYSCLAFDVVLDGWLNDLPTLTEGEKADMVGIAKMQTLMAECISQAERDRNDAIVPFVKQVVEVLNAWETCIVARQKSIAEK
jgi:hypothetical protein